MSFDRERVPDAVTYHQEAGRKIIGPGSWFSTSCHGCGGSDPMRVNRRTGGYCCMNCGIKGGDVLAFHMDATGLEFVEACKDLGAWVDDDKPVQKHRPAPLPPRQALQVMAFESTLAAVAAANVAHGVTLAPQDRARLMVAAGRINRLAEAYQ